jgi:Cu-Zn family superoxide dismutase
MRKTMPVLIAAMTLSGGLAGCGGASPKTTTTPTPAPGKPSQLATAQFAVAASVGPQPSALTYDAALIPTTGTATVTEAVTGNRTTVTLTVRGLPTNHQFGAHVHTKKCGPQPADAGPHYQNMKDPVTPSTNPEYANTRNEVWLDFTTDGQGSASATSTVDWKFRPGEANSVVIHAMHTATEPGKAGTAGGRLACITAPFGS